MSERDAKVPAEPCDESPPRDESPPLDVPQHPLPPEHPGRHEHEACGEGTMERMLNEALGRAARQIKIDPQTGLLLPCPPGDTDSNAVADPVAKPPAAPDAASAR